MGTPIPSDVYEDIDWPSTPPTLECLLYAGPSARHLTHFSSFNPHSDYSIGTVNAPISQMSKLSHIAVKRPVQGHN